MGSVSVFPKLPTRRDPRHGTVHVMPASDGDGGYDVSHESHSGDSWGGFSRFDDAAEAVATAYRWARDQYDGAEVAIWPAVADALPVTPGPASPGLW